MVVEVCSLIKEPEKQEADSTIVVQHFPDNAVPRQEKSNKGVCCSVLLFILVLGLIGTSIYFGITSYQNKNKLKTLQMRCSGSTYRLNLFNPSPKPKQQTFDLSVLSDDDWQMIANTVAGCVTEAEDLEIDELPSEIDVEEEQLYSVDRDCLKEQLMQLNDYVVY